MRMKTHICDKCQKEISLNNFQKHHDLCDGGIKRKEYLEKLEHGFTCDCGKIFKTTQALAGHKTRSHSDSERQSQAGLKGFQKRVDLGHKFGTPHSPETKDKLSRLACERLAKHSKYSKNVEYKPGVILESSYEVRVAEILDQLEIEWIKVRNGYVWDDNGKTRRYIPDFYLPKFNIFLDPKNDYLIVKDKRKIESAMLLNNIKVIVLSDKEICIKSIKDLLL